MRRPGALGLLAGRIPRGCYPPTLSGGRQWFEQSQLKPLHRWMARYTPIDLPAPEDPVLPHRVPWDPIPTVSPPTFRRADFLKALRGVQYHPNARQGASCNVSWPGK
ncbi:hypothetical protein SBA6_40023 [Candidatus Sulfopaludibacter sp. SbA6]|nr:hypothetical protein SBA6_40023 [Candidatus Sulfopaludibacter sp. SbA6]